MYLNLHIDNGYLGTYGRSILHPQVTAPMRTLPTNVDIFKTRVPKNILSARSASLKLDQDP